MTDTITPESLRALADRPVILQMGPSVSGALRAAADEIERLQTEYSKLSEQFDKIAALAGWAVSLAEDQQQDPYARFRSQVDWNAKPASEVAP